MVVQVYRGWALFGIAVFAALIFTGAHTLLVRSEPTASPQRKRSSGSSPSR